MRAGMTGTVKVKLNGPATCWECARLASARVEEGSTADDSGAAGVSSIGVMRSTAQDKARLSRRGGLGSTPMSKETALAEVEVPSLLPTPVMGGKVLPLSSRRVEQWVWGCWLLCGPVAV